ncbi:MAG: PD-(D/E)XK nuclease family protein, partial [Planctomycetota bacterium]
ALPGEREARIEGSGPRPGCLHVAHALSGGHSGRPHTFVVGLDDARFPGAGLQDPLLLDGERRRLSRDLPTASARLGESTAEFARMLARLRGNVTLSFPCRDLVDDRETFASPVVTAAYRILSGDRRGDQAELDGWLGAPASFAPDGPERALDESEWWLWRLCGPESTADPAALVEKRFGHLARGRKALERRRALEFTVYDGHVPDAGSWLDPTSARGRVMSATSLETLARCPRAYFFRYALRIEPPEELDVEADTWLDPGAFGTLLHEVFNRFMAELMKKGEKPVRARHEAALFGILEEVIEAYRRDHPPANDGAYRRQRDELRYAARVFLTEEERYCRAADPAYLEEWVGPVAVDLPGGRRIRAHGRIDRVDRLEGGTFAVWDYKTGSPYRFRGRDPFNQGRTVQHALYLEIARAMLEDRVSPDARPTRFGYFFPSARGQGERIEYAREDLSDGMKVLGLLCDVVRAGSFIATDETSDCRYCDYAPICGHGEEAADLCRRKREAAVNEALAAFRELRQEEEPRAATKRPKSRKKAAKKKPTKVKGSAKVSAKSKTKKKSKEKKNTKRKTDRDAGKR